MFYVKGCNCRMKCIPIYNKIKRETVNNVQYVYKSSLNK